MRGNSSEPGMGRIYKGLIGGERLLYSVFMLSKLYMVAGSVALICKRFK